MAGAVRAGGGGGIVTHTYPIPNVPGYEITEDGEVYSVDYNWRGYGKRQMAQHPNSDGYPSVRLTVGRTRKRYTVHKLVAQTFINGPSENCDQLCHCDGNKNNNHYKNLRWGNSQDNAIDREKHGNTSRGLLHSLAIKKGLQK